MSIDSALQRVAAINQAIANPTALAALTGGAAAPGEASTPVTSTASGGATFAAALQSARAGYGSAGSGSPTPVASFTPAAASISATGLSAQAPGAGSQILAAAESQIGQAEQPPGSNESPAIAAYRGATAGAVPGEPWCACFASWAARQAGAPLGAEGQGLGSVSAIWGWAQGAGRAVPNGPGVTPKPGDLIVFGAQHVGIVRGVLPDGRIQTVEGNYENKVSLNVRPAGEASGYVSMS